MEKSPKRAAEVLEENPDMHPVIAAYFEAYRDGTLPQHFLRRFKKYREEYEDDIPEPDIDPAHPDYRAARLNLIEHAQYLDSRNFKCRGSVIQGIGNGFFKTIEDGVIKDPEVIRVIEEFRHRDWSALRGAKGEFWTTPEEIAYINQVLDFVIAHLKETYAI